ncbi:MAG: response regulator [Deltaproteobacteria bacterium]|nr:response regulator [Deltaproteobacteria bacterium]
MSGKTLLFADDSATMRMIMEKTFKGEDFEVITVPSGQAAIEKAKEIIPDIIIADAGMAGISGYDVCKAVKDEPSLSHLPLVIMSGISTPYDENRGTDSGVTTHIKKPFDTTKIIEEVIELTQTHPKTASVAKPSMPAPSSMTGQPPVKPERPSLNATLHAFPRPDAPQGAVPPAKPQMEKPPLPPVNPRATADFKMPLPPRDPEPIEFDDSEADNHIHVGTLAELAQMNDKGAIVEQEQRDDAIELDAQETASPSTNEETDFSETSPASIIPEPIDEDEDEPVTAVKTASKAAASKVAAGVAGLTMEQAEAITALTEEVIEKVVWEVVPDLAETIIKEKLERLLKE